MITTGIRHLQKRGRLLFDQQWALQVDELDSVLLEHLPHFVHIACRGGEDGGLVMEDSMGRSVVVPSETVAEILTLFSDSIRCVLFTSGMSQSAAQVLAENINCVISLGERVLDKAAIAFSSSFYQALGLGQSVQRAFDLACARVAAKRMSVKPKLYAKPGSANNLTI